MYLLFARLIYHYYLFLIQRLVLCFILEKKNA